jgi:predicted ATPase with chaperone activity
MFHLPDNQDEADYSIGHVQRYQQQISGPLLDRVDVHMEMARVPFQKLASLDAGEASAKALGTIVQYLPFPLADQML